MKVTLLYVFAMYNINKYFIEYPKHMLFVYYDGKNSYLNLIIKHCDNEYVFVRFVYRNIKIIESIKKYLNEEMKMMHCIQ